MKRPIPPFLRGWMEATGSQHKRKRVRVTSVALPVPAATAPCQENHKIKFSIKKVLGKVPLPVWREMPMS